MVKPSLATSATRFVLAICMVAVFAAVAVAQIESRVGTWELDPTKSTFSPGPPPQRETLIYRAAGPQWTALLQGIDASGKPINPDVGNLLIKFDGRDHSTPTADYETTAWKRVDDRTYLVIRKKAGKVVLTSTNVLSAPKACRMLPMRYVTLVTTGSCELSTCCIFAANWLATICWRSPSRSWTIPRCAWYL